MSELAQQQAAVALLKAGRDIQWLQSDHYPDPLTGKPWSNHKEKTA